MSRIFYFVLIFFFAIGFLFFAFEVVNTMLSLKYETNYPDDCISAISGTDLCLMIKIFKGLTVICGVGLISLLFFKRKIVQQ